MNVTTRDSFVKDQFQTMGMIKKILIVDDSFNNLLLLDDLLTEMNYNVSVAHDGVEAMQILMENPQDLVLLDIMMPRKGGFELLEDMRKQNIKTPVIFITAKSSDEERMRATELGAADFIAKPVIISEVLDKVQQALAAAE
ncbi:MAG: response regulator [Salinivirgaceae bacterium]|jgi:DNA-binding response OmpR family regulator|nr:response regulator [Salinivirgaceae bacterium]